MAPVENQYVEYYRKQASHVLGLRDNPTEGLANESWWRLSACHSTKERFENLKDGNVKDKTLNFAYLSSYEYSRPRREKGETGVLYHGFASQWPGHTFSVHRIDKEHEAHYIYVNRGEPHEEGFSDTAIAFTVPNDQKEAFEKKFFETFSSSEKKMARREDIAKYLNEEMKGPFYDKPISEKLSQLKQQTVGNCTVANSNIAWHLKLAADRMNKYPNNSFIQAYDKTESRYQKLRKQDKALQFSLLMSRGSYDQYQYKENYFNDVGSVLEKFFNKDIEYPEEAVIPVVLKNMSAQDINYLYEQLNLNQFKNLSEDASRSWKENIELHLARNIDQFKDLNELSSPLSEIVNFVKKDLANQIKDVINQPKYLKFFDDNKQTAILNEQSEYLPYASDIVQTQYLNSNPEKLEHAPETIQEIACQADPEKYLKFANQKIQTDFVNNDWERYFSCSSTSFQLLKLTEDGGLDNWNIASEDAKMAYVKYYNLASMSTLNTESQVELLKSDAITTLWGHASEDAKMAYVKDYNPQWMSTLNTESQVELLKSDAMTKLWGHASQDARKQVVKESLHYGITSFEPEEQKDLLRGDFSKFKNYAEHHIQAEVLSEGDPKAWDVAHEDVRMLTVKNHQPEWIKFLSPQSQQKLLYEDFARYQVNFKNKEQAQLIGRAGDRLWHQVGSDVRLCAVKKFHEKWFTKLDDESQINLLIKEYGRFSPYVESEKMAQLMSEDESNVLWNQASEDIRKMCVEVYRPEWIVGLDENVQNELYVEDPEKYHAYVSPSETESSDYSDDASDDYNHSAEEDDSTADSMHL